MTVPNAAAALTDLEHETINMLGEIAGRFGRIVGDGPTRDADLREAVILIHGLQRMVMAQAIARACPDLYRVLGGTVDTS